MKDRTLASFALVLSIAALGYAVWIHLHADQIAMEVLRRRELEFVRHYAPKMKTIYADMNADMGPGSRTNAFAAEPKTIEELFMPFVNMINQIDHAPDGITTNRTSK